MWLQYRELKLIQTSGRPDEHNEAILRGDFLDKTPKYEYPEDYDSSIDGEFGRPVEIPFVMPSRDEMIKQFIFPDWQVGDIIVIADSPLKHPKRQGDTLVEMTREEVCATGDLSVLDIGEVYQDGKITKVDVPKGMLKPTWEYPRWVEKATSEELTEKYHSIIDEQKEELLELGYLFRGNRQKVRENDKSWLSLRIQAMTIDALMKKQITPVYELLVDKSALAKEGWVIDTGDVVFYDVLDLVEMLSEGSEWSSALFKAEQVLKAKSPNLLITIDDFRAEIEKLTTIDCYTI